MLFSDSITYKCCKKQVVYSSSKNVGDDKMTQAQALGDAKTQQILYGSLFPLLLKMASPNAIAFLLQAAVSMTEVWYVGQLGTISLAAIALVFPMLMLMQMMSAGALGGAVTSSIARALGAGEIRKAETLVWHAVILAFTGAGSCLILYWIGGGRLLSVLGGEGDVLRQAILYADILFTGAVVLWLTNTLSAVYRGMGNMQFPAAVMMFAAVLQVPLSGALILGWQGLPQMGIVGAAISAITVGFISASVLVAGLTFGNVTVPLRFSNFRLNKTQFSDITKVAFPASLSPLLTVLSILILTGLMGRFGNAALAGFGIGSRLEFLLVPMVFGIGAAMTSMVGVNVGAKNMRRAEKIGWVGGAFAGALTGVIGCAAAYWPGLWVGIFTNDRETFDVGFRFLQIVGPCFAFQGLGLSLYFASQGAGKVSWPVLATIFRFAVTVSGAFIGIHWFGGGPDTVFYFAGLGMVLYGTITATAISLGAWRTA
ncbi:MAG: putative MATE family efflux protein [Oceanicoccus sp.]